jgi:hypothetical protein
MANNLNTLNDDSFYIKNLIMKTFTQLFFWKECISSWILDFWNQIYGLISWLDC